MPKINLEITEQLAWLLSKPKRIKIAVGGRGSQKSTGIGDIMLAFADQGERICCTREFQNSIDDSVHENLKQEIERLGLEGFNILKTEITTSNNGELFYKGLARNITSLKSLAGIKRLWIEEGESVSKHSLRVLTPSIRSSASANLDESDPPEIWITMNWGSSSGAIAQKYLKRARQALLKTGYYEDDMVMAVRLNWRDNPWFPPELEQERADDYENLTRGEYDAIWEDAYDDTVENAIIPPEWFDAAIDAHIKLGIDPTGVEVVSHDPSDLGPDPKGLCYRHGILIKDMQEKENGTIHDGAVWALNYAIDAGVDWFIWDGDGMGVGVRQSASEYLSGKKIEAHMFRGSEGPNNPHQTYMKPEKKDVEGRKNREVFANKRAQFAWLLRDRFFNTYQAVVKKKYIDPDTIISISSDIDCLDKLRAEVCSIPKKPNGAGKIQIVSKEELKKKPYELPSPNLFDSLMMAWDVPEMQNDAIIDDDEYHHHANSWMN